MTSPIDLIKEQFRESAAVQLDMAEQISEQIAEVEHVLLQALKNGGKVMWCGNGGSAADSQHLATELLSRLRLNRPAIASLALTTNTSLLTAHTNDFGFDDVFSRQVEALGKKGDILVGISTSGKSPNVINAVQKAKEMNIKTIALTGKDLGGFQGLADYCIGVPSQSTQRIQEGHITIGHILCDLIERELFDTEKEGNA